MKEMRMASCASCAQALAGRLVFASYFTAYLLHGSKGQIQIAWRQYL